MGEVFNRWEGGVGKDLGRCSKVLNYFLLWVGMGWWFWFLVAFLGLVRN